MRKGGIAWLLGTGFCVAQAIGQSPMSPSLCMSDSSGYVPAQRLNITPRSTAASWWKRTAEQHLLDFSDREEGANVVVVDPVVQASMGALLPSSGMMTVEPEPQTTWDNIRGARFQAIIDDRWHVGGELLERQGIAEPLLGYWAAQNRIPGWGRSKLGKDNGFNTWEEAYFDVSRTRGWVGWQLGNWEFDTGVDALHVGAGRSSAFLSRQAVPTPYARVSRKTPKGRTSLWNTRWMSTRRGPLGETAESLLERSRALFLTHAQSIGKHWVLRGVYNLSWETTQLTIDDEVYRPIRQVAGGECQFHTNLGNSMHLVGYVQQSWDFGLHKRNVADGELRRFVPLTSVAGIQASAKRLQARLEFGVRGDGHCRDCWQYEQGETAYWRPELATDGISLHQVWRESLRFELKGTPLDRLYISSLIESNTVADQVRMGLEYTVHTVWPLSICITAGQIYMHEWEEAYPIYSIGVSADIARWE